MILLLLSLIVGAGDREEIPVGVHSRRWDSGIPSSGSSPSHGYGSSTLQSSMARPVFARVHGVMSIHKRLQSVFRTDAIVMFAGSIITIVVSEREDKIREIK